MDAILTQQEEQEVRDSIEQFAKSPQVQADGGILKLFCQHWPTVKQILEFLKRFLPAKVVAVIDALIRIGDWAHGNPVICPR